MWVSLWPEPLRFSMPFRVSPAASPPLAEPARATRTACEDPGVVRPVRAVAAVDLLRAFPAPQPVVPVAAVQLVVTRPVGRPPPARVLVVLPPTTAQPIRRGPRQHGPAEVGRTEGVGTPLFSSWWQQSTVDGQGPPSNRCCAMAGFRPLVEHAFGRFANVVTSVGRPRRRLSSSSSNRPVFRCVVATALVTSRGASC